MILLYHNVFSDTEYQKRSPSRIAISRSAFENQILWLRRRFNIVTLDEYVSRLCKGSNSLRKVIAITFDDGIKSTYENVYPYLVQRKVPATMFVATGHLNGGGLLYFTYFYALCYESQYGSINVGGLPYPLSNMSERVLALQAVQAAALRSGDPIEYARDLKSKYPLQPVDSWLYEGMTKQQVKQAAQDEVMEIGAHTVHHPYLSRLGYSDQLIEISQGKDTLEAICGKPVSFFAYPSGDYDRASLEIMEVEKFKAACAVNPKQIGTKAHFELERIGIYSRSVITLQLKMILTQLKFRRLGLKFS